MEAFFLPVPQGHRFCLLREPAPSVPVRGAVVYVHPFAEEMNKVRRMASLQAKAMAGAGYFVLQIDLHGCGDSSGDFGDASWERWIEDVAAACTRLRERTDAELWLWGLRTGCLLATEAAKRLDGPTHLLMWQPTLSGKQFLQQFLRLKVAGEMLAGESKGLMERLRLDLEHGKAVEVGGYRLSPGLAKGLELAELALPDSAMRVEWIEVSGRADGGLSPAAAMRLEKWRELGHAVRGHVACGPTFWQTTEIEDCPALVDATLAAMCTGLPG
jgi:exosortase A-associated hydrolase 2